MADDILTQNVIDNLLAQAMGKTDTSYPQEETFRSVRAYDFRHPSKLSKEQLRALELIFEGFARDATHNLSTMMRTQVHVGARVGGNKRCSTNTRRVCHRPHC